MGEIKKIVAFLYLVFVNTAFVSAYDVKIDGIFYNMLSEGTIEVTYGERYDNSYSGDVVIPENIVYNGKHYIVQSIGSFAFRWCEDLVSVTIPSTVTVIKGQSFSGSTKLEKVNIPDNVKTIGDAAFSGCTGLISLFIPKGVQTIGDEAFKECSGLTSIIVDERNLYYDSRSGCNAIIRKSDLSLILGCANTIIPNGIKSIGPYAFFNCEKLKSITFPTSLISIEYYSFWGCKGLTSLTIPYNVSNIGSHAFWGCGGLISITVHNSNSSYDSRDNCNAIIQKSNNSLILGCGNTIIPNSVTSLAFGAFAYCSNLTTITIPSSVKDFEGHTFAGCENLTSIILPDGLKNIGSNSFSDCISLSSITIPDEVTSIGSRCFSGCSSLSNIVLPNSLTTIETSAFSYCKSLTSVVIPNSVKTIGEQAFWPCPSLETIVIGSGVSSIEGYNFSQCKRLSQVESMLIKPIEIDNTIFAENSPNAILIVPKGTRNSYESSSWKNKFKEIQEKTNTYFLIIRALGSGSVNFGEIDIRNTTKTFTVNEGATATIIVTPDTGKKIKSVKKDGVDVTSSVSDDKYTISNINADTSIEVEFEAIPLTTYTLSIWTVGNGSATYDGLAVRNTMKTFTVNEGTTATISIKADDGYRIRSVKKDGMDVTSSVSDNKYTISDIKADVSIEVEFEIIIIPPTTVPLTIKAIGNGSVSYDGARIRNSSKSFTVTTGTTVTINITPDAGYRIKSVKKDAVVVTSSVSNNQYSINEIKSGTSVEVEFEAVPTYTLSIKATGNGTASYEGTNIRNATRIFIVNEGTTATINLEPDEGYRVKSVKKDGTVVTSSVSDNKYTISSINANTFIEVEYEAIPPTTYTLTIKTSGFGTANFNYATIRNTTKTFTVNEGSNAIIKIIPDSGYRIKSVNHNGTDVNSKISENQYVINNINEDTTIEVEFETIPPTTYSLTVKATGNGSAIYDGTIVRNLAVAFTVNEGTMVILSLKPDDGYRIKNVSHDGADVTSSISENQYVINSIRKNTVIEVEFEAIPPTTYILSVKAMGNGAAIYNDTAIRDMTMTFTVTEGMTATISLKPDDGYRIKSVNHNGTDVISSVSESGYVVRNINANTSVEVEFEAIPPTTYVLTISAIGNGLATFDGTTIRSKTSTFTVNVGSGATITFSPDSGYRIKIVKVGSNDVTASVLDNTYTVSNIQSDITISVEFEAIPITTYILTIKAVGNGTAAYNGMEVRSGAQTFNIKEGTSAVVTFTPDNGFHIETVKVNGTDVTMGIVDGQYIISSMTADTSVEVMFAENIKAFACQGLNYTVTSYEGKTVSLANSNYGRWIEVPAKVNYLDREWTVMGADADALKSNEELAAVIWHPNVVFTATVSNPNLLFYVNAEGFAPASIKNVVVNNVANNIELVEAASGNSFYCPQEFMAKHIIYSHNYNMTTGIGEAKGWETIALPFDVQRVMHESKGELVPFAKWKSGDEAKPFWLMQMESDGWKDADKIKAYIPYIISMPNNEGYKTEFLLNGKVTFSAENIVVRKTEVETSASYKGRTFVPTFSEVGMGDGAYALNVSNDYEMNVSGVTDGSRFVLNLRRVHPFEAYMKTNSAKTRAIDISDGMGVTDSDDEQEVIRIYNLKGQMMESEQKQSVEEMKRSLPAGVYIINGKKMMVK